MTRAYEYRHAVMFQDTNLVGNVYFANYVAWQGKCREHFLRERAPDVVAQMRHGLSLITVSCRCDYLAELAVFDEIAIRMTLLDAVQNRIDLHFDYVRLSPGGEQPVAVGGQRIAFMRREHDRMMPVAIPDSLLAALTEYR